MNIEDFNSCLNYIKAMPADKGTINYILPIVTTILGAALAFGINYYRDKTTDSKTTKNKLLCIREEIQRINTHLEHVFSQCLLLHEELTINENFLGHSIPSKIDSFFINENFISIAHKYTTQERDQITNLMSLLTRQNEHLLLMNESFDPEQVQYWQKKCLNTLNNTLFCIIKCRALINKEDKKLNLIELADELNVTSTLIVFLRTELKKKAKTSNATT